MYSIEDNWLIWLEVIVFPHLLTLQKKQKTIGFHDFFKTMTSRLKTFSSKIFSLCWSWEWKSEKQKKIT